MNNKIYGYLRVSTDKQDLENNRNEILKKANEVDIISKVEWIEETISGTIHWKQRQLGTLVGKLIKGDCIITSELSRIGRTIAQIMEFIAEIDKIGCKLYLTKTDFAIDNTISSQVLQFAYSLSSQLERELISSRTKTALKSAKDRGVQLGRKKEMILDKNPNNLRDIQNLLNIGCKIGFIAKKYNVSTQTMYRYILKHELTVKKINETNLQLSQCIQCNEFKKNESYSKQNPKLCRKCVISNNKTLSNKISDSLSNGDIYIT